MQFGGGSISRICVDCANDLKADQENNLFNSFDSIQVNILKNG